MSKKALDSYRKIKITTSSPAGRVVLVYGGIIKKLNEAILAFDDPSPSRMETINNAIQLAEKLIVELQVALDKENGGEIAERLEALYEFWLNHLSLANRGKNRQKVIDVLKMVQELHESWAKIEKQSQNGALEDGNE